MSSAGLYPLAAGVDHLIWSVESLDEAIDRLVERMGLPLLYGPSGDAATRVADIGLGTCWVRLVEKRAWRTNQPISLAFRSSLPIYEAECAARSRGYLTGGVALSPCPWSGKGMDAGPNPFASLAFLMLRGVVAASEPGVLLLRYFHSAHSYRLRETSAGTCSLAAVRVEISEEEGARRWAGILGSGPESCRNCWSLPDGGSVEAVLGGSNRISSLVLANPNLRALRRFWIDAGISCWLCHDTLVVAPEASGGLPIRVREMPRR